MLYHPNFEKPFYLSTDASNLAAGAFLYQVEGYERTEKGKKKMLRDLGFEIEGGGMESHMLPGVSPGKNTPIVTEFAGDAEKIKKYDTFDTLRNDLSMTEKVKKLNEKYVLHVRPISFSQKVLPKVKWRAMQQWKKNFMH